MRRRKVLFLCTHNSARSQMAEGLLRALAPDAFEAMSAGTEATSVRPEAVAVMAEWGHDLSGQRSKSLEALDDDALDLVITLCGSARAGCPAFPGPTRKRHWPIDDPAAVEGSERERLAAFRRARDEIEGRIREELLNAPSASEPPVGRGEIPEREEIAARLEAVRERTLALVAVLDWQTLGRQQVEILSPMIWDLGHIGNFEDLWLCQELAGLRAVEKTYERMFDATLNPRSERAALPLPRGEALFGYLASVRERALEILFDPPGDLRSDLLVDRLVYELVAEHEEQHQETLLQAIQLLEEPSYTPAQRRRLPVAGEVDAGMVPIPAGEFLMGAGADGFAYDNEKDRHPVAVDDFEIDRFPVSQGEYLYFVDAGGYDQEEHWSEAGWAWRREAGVSAPLNWRRTAEGWRVRFLDREMPVPESDPVIHVCYWEAEAYARSVGKRLPTEAEWEKAALWDPRTEESRRYPWGDASPSRRLANLDQLAFRPAPRGAYPAGASAYGVEQMAGDVWEWTASDFEPYPGFRAFPYAEYSEIFFGPDHKVLRGGSWATRAAVARGTFRNWDFPIRRQIFAGFRCAR